MNQAFNVEVFAEEEDLFRSELTKLLETKIMGSNKMMKHATTYTGNEPKLPTLNQVK